MAESGKQCESEDCYRQLVELSPDPIVVHSEGKIVFVNRAAVMLTGAKTENELIGQPVTQFIHPDSLERALERIQNALKASKPIPLAAEEFLAADGTPYEVVSQPTTYDGKPAMHAIIRDISARKRIEGELQRHFSLSAVISARSTMAMESSA